MKIAFKNKKILFFSVILSCALFQISSVHAFKSLPFEEGARWKTCFSPKPYQKVKCTDLLTDLIKSATNTIHMQAYSFTSKPIADELIAAAERGVKVKVLLDYGRAQNDYSQIHNLTKSKVHVYTDKPTKLMHNKVIIIDEKIVITGSFNYSYSADHGNAENVLAIQDRVLAKEYVRQWLLRLQRENTRKQKIIRYRAVERKTETPSKNKARRRVEVMGSPRFQSPKALKRKKMFNHGPQSDQEPKRSHPSRFALKPIPFDHAAIQEITVESASEDDDSNSATTTTQTFSSQKENTKPELPAVAME